LKKLTNSGKSKYIGIILLALCLSPLHAQQISLEAAIYQGTIWRHSPKLTTQTGEAINGQELSIRCQTLGRRSWQAWQRYPSMGAALAHFQLGNGSHERAFGLLPWLNIPVLRAGWFTANFRVGTGIAWVTQPYNWWDNPNQNAIGSHWNNMTQFRVGAEAVLNPQTRLLVGGSFTHFSNGGAALPNYGINVLSGWIGATWSPRAVSKTDFKPATTSRKRIVRRLGALLQGGFSAVQIATFDGPKYPIWSGTGGVFYRFNKLHRFSIGLDYERNQAIYTWGLHSARFADANSARQASTRLAVFIGEEFLFGDIGIQLQIGRYLGEKFNTFVPKQLYSKLAMRYYLPESIASPVRPFLGITLKAHAFTAEYIAWNVGLAF
jgi:hypothetical protein